MTSSFLTLFVSDRSRLSLDLSSPTITNTAIDHSKLAQTPTKSSTPTSVTKLNTPTSPLVANSAPFPSRYTEFKTYSSTFDGLQALESHNGTNITVSIVNGSRATPQVNSSPDNPLMRVASLPAIAPQNQLAGNYLCISKAFTFTNEIPTRRRQIETFHESLSTPRECLWRGSHGSSVEFKLAGARSAINNLSLLTVNEASNDLRHENMSEHATVVELHVSCTSLFLKSTFVDCSLLKTA